MTADPMLDRIARFITRHDMFPPSSQVGVAVSGGADSVFLLEALRALAPSWNLHLSIVHIDHGIRGAASRADAGFVQSLALTLGLPFYLHQADVPAIRDNLEQAARGVRHAFYAQLLSAGTVHRIATGHTRSDQAETVLYRILRGSGLAGLAGILPVTEEGIVRPLLEIGREEIECWLRRRGIRWQEDATNQDRAYARNRLRHEILPLLRQNFNLRLDEVLGHMATLALDEESYWASEISTYPTAGPGQPQILSCPELAAKSPALARRLIRRALRLAKGDLRKIDFAHVERVLQMVHSARGHDRAQLPGPEVIRSFEWIRVAPKGLDPPPGFVFSIPMKAPGSVELPCAHARIILQVQEKATGGEACGKVVNELDWERFPSPDGALPGLEVRNWRPGDQYQRVGQAKLQRIKSLFQEARIPLWERWYWPIVTYNGVIVWAKRFGAAAGFAAGPSSRRVLQIGVSSECRNRLDQA